MLKVESTLVFELLESTQRAFKGTAVFKIDPISIYHLGGGNNTYFGRKLRQYTQNILHNVVHFGHKTPDNIFK